MPGSKPTDGPACPCAASAQAEEVQSTPTAAHSTTQTASCSCKKLIKLPASSKSPELEAEPIYETRSSVTVISSIVRHDGAVSKYVVVSTHTGSAVCSTGKLSETTFKTLDEGFRS